MEKMFASMLKAAGLDPDRLEVMIKATTDGVADFKARLERIEEAQARIERKLDALCASAARNENNG